MLKPEETETYVEITREQTISEGTKWTSQETQWKPGNFWKYKIKCSVQNVKLYLYNYAFTITLV